MDTHRLEIQDRNGEPISTSTALIWGNNAAWLCIKCGQLLGNRTGDTEFQVECSCGNTYEIDRGPNRNGNLHQGPALGVRLTM